MKRVISFVLVLCLLVPFGICGAFAEDGSSWELTEFVDDFGDPTGEACVQGIFSGTFSNAATSASDLTVVVFYDPENDIFSFRLLEYGQVGATYSSSDEDEIVFKIKTGETISEGSLKGIAPNEDLYLAGGDDINTVVKQIRLSLLIKNILKTGDSVRCIIEIGSSKYNFEMTGAGFADCLTEFGIDNDVNITPDSGTVTINGTINIRTGPGTDYSVLTAAKKGDRFPVTGKCDIWYQIYVNGDTGYVKEQFCD